MLLMLPNLLVLLLLRQLVLQQSRWVTQRLLTMTDGSWSRKKHRHNLLEEQQMQQVVTLQKQGVKSTTNWASCGRLQ